MLNKNQRLVIGVTMPCILWQKLSTGSGRGLCPHVRSGGSSVLGAHSRGTGLGAQKLRLCLPLLLLSPPCPHRSPGSIRRPPLASLPRSPLDSGD